MGHILSSKLTDEFRSNLEAIIEARKGKPNQTSAKRLAIDAGLGETAVRDILQGKSLSPRLETVNKIAHALKVPVYRLMPSMIDQSYDELVEKEEELQLLREVSDIEYQDIHDLRQKALNRAKKK